MKFPILLVVWLSYWVIGAQDCMDEVHYGEGTYYGGIDGTSSGNCSLPIALGDYFYAAMNTTDYDGSAACGACIELTGVKGTVTLRIVDRCPECKPGDVDMTVQAFGAIAEVIDGRVPIHWKYVPCDAQDTTIKINFKEGSSQYWTAIQFRNLNYGIATMDYKDGNGVWQNVPRALFNFFIKEEGIPSPMALRITAVTGEQLIFENVPLVLQSDFDTGVQFSTPSNCSPTGIPMPVTVESVKEIFLYPNPTTDFFFINRDTPVAYELFNVYGALVKSGTVTNQEEPIVLGYLSRGLYYVVMEQQGFPLVLQ